MPHYRFPMEVALHIDGIQILLRYESGRVTSAENPGGLLTREQLAANLAALRDFDQACSNLNEEPLTVLRPAAKEEYTVSETTVELNLATRGPTPLNLKLEYDKGTKEFKRGPRPAFNISFAEHLYAVAVTRRFLQLIDYEQ